MALSKNLCHLKDFAMEKTRYEGVWYRTNRRGMKTFVARFKINGVEYRKKLGEEPQINAKVASQLRYEMIEKIKRGEDEKVETINDIFKKYIILRSPTLSKSWGYNMEKTYNKHLKDMIGELTPDTLHSNMVQLKINDMLANGYAVSTVKQIKDCLGGMYSHMISGYVNVGRALIIPKFDNKIYFTISEEEAKELYRVITNYEIMQWRVYFSFLLHGRRRSETALMKCDDVNVAEGTYVIHAENSKTGKRMKAPMLPFLTDMLKEYDMGDGFLFKGRYGEMVSKSGIDYHWTRIKERAGLPKMRLHDMRHLMGYIAVNNGFSLEEIAHVLGHNSTATTMRYSNMSMDTAKRTLEGIHSKLK